MPLSSAEQVAAARRSALLVPSPEHAVFAVTGGDRVRWLNGLVTCDLAKVSPGGAAYGLAVGPKGKIVCDLVAIVEPSRLLVVVPRETRATLRASLERYLIMEDAEMSDVDDVAIAFAHGPRAEELATRLREAGITAASLDRTGLGGAVVVAPASAEVAAIVASIDGAVGDDAGWDALRLERAIPRFGADFDAALYPQEASLEKTAVSFNKGCYLGQEVVCMLEMRGHVKRKLVPIVLDAREVPAAKAEVADEAGEVVGAITSGATSPTLGAPVALALVKLASAQPGTKLRVGSAEARVVDRPA